ncbi:MAG: FAD-binding oxidoreductase, partial [Pirellulales bacterium]
MDPANQRIEEDLRGILRGEVHCDDLTTQLYSTDGSVYEIRPLGVVRPRSLRDVVATVQYAAENKVPIYPRGAGT